MHSSYSKLASQTTQLCIAAFLAFVLVATSFAGIGRNGISGGRVTAFASIFVNDRELDIENAIVTIDGQQATKSDLKLGQSVLVNGILDDELPVGVADEVIVNTGVRGDISSIDDDELTVLGTTVSVDPDTLVATLGGISSVGALVAGDLVSVSGFRTSNGNLLATRIDQLAQLGDFLITGSAANVTAAALQINALAIDTSGAILNGFPTGVVTAGDNVRIRGGSLGPTGELIAATVDFIAPINTIGEELGEFEGLISDFVSPTDFKLAGIQITTDGDTGFIGGGPANLTNDANVVVRGGFDTTGVLLANEMTIRGTRIRVNGKVEFANATSITVLGIPIVRVSETELKDNSESEVEPLSLSEISAGDYVESRSFRNPPHITPVIAERIERDEAEHSVRLQGFVDTIGAQRIQVLGSFVNIVTGTEFEDADEQEISSQEFFNAITPGTFVKIFGEKTSTSNIVASQISFEIDN